MSGNMSGREKKSTVCLIPSVVVPLPYLGPPKFQVQNSNSSNSSTPPTARAARDHLATAPRSTAELTPPRGRSPLAIPTGLEVSGSVGLVPR